MGNPVVHFEIGCSDKARTEAFFRTMFGWTITEAGPASMIDTGAGERDQRPYQLARARTAPLRHVLRPGQRYPGLSGQG